MNQARRSNDLQMSQLERSPEGFNALRRLYAVRNGKHAQRVRYLVTSEIGQRAVSPLRLVFVL